MKFEGKKVLVVGLGSLGGGVSAVKWFLNKGADVTVTDLRPEEKPKDSTELLGKDKDKVNFVLDGHKKMITFLVIPKPTESK